MRWREALRDSVRDIASGAGWTATFAVLFFVLVGGLALSADFATVQTIAAARSYVESGSATYVMKADGRIDGRACEALASRRAVSAAGALREGGALLFASQLPQTPITAFTVSPGFSQIVDHTGNPRHPGIALSKDAAHSLGLQAGNRLTTDQGSTTVNAVFSYPDDGRDSSLAFAALVAAPVGDEPFDACWVTIWPQDEAAVAAMGSTVLPDDGPEPERPVLSQLNQTRGQAFSVVTAFHHHDSALLAVAVGAVLGATQVFRRRLALASDRHVGVERLAQVVTQASQTAVWSATGIAATTAVAVACLPVGDVDLVPLLLGTATVLCAGASAAVCSCAVATCLIRERALFRYFKNR